jgi:hypothetical protein
MDMKKILQSFDNVTSTSKADGNSIKKFLQIVEGSNTISQPSMPTMQVTSKVLNVKEDATPGMFGKYFKTVEQEFVESAERSKDRARLLAERVIERIVPGQEPAPGINRLTGKPIEPAAAPAAPAPAGPTLSSKYGPGYEGSPEAYTITVNGKNYKFAGREKQGPGTGEIIKVPGGAVGIRGLAPVSVEIGQDGMFYIAAPAN